LDIAQPVVSAIRTLALGRETITDDIVFSPKSGDWRTLKAPKRDWRYAQNYVVTTKRIAPGWVYRQERGLLRLGYPSAINWALLTYAVFAVALGWAFVVSRIHADYEQTLMAERNRLRAVATALQDGMSAMLNDGVGAAVASANELQAGAGLINASREEIVSTLQKQLTGGAYVRFIFLTDHDRFALASRDGAVPGTVTPSWLMVASLPPSASTWVGRPIADPEHPTSLVIPFAQRVRWGEDQALWAGALFSFDGLEHLYRQFSDQVLMLAVIGSDGTILARIPKVQNEGQAAGDNVASSELFRRALGQGNAGVVEGYGPAVRTDMIYAYDLLNGYSAYMVAGQTRDAALAAWQDRRRLSIAATAAFSALVMIMTALLNHYILSLRRREHHYRTLFNNAQFSVFLLEGNRFVDANRTVARMFGLDTERAAVGLTPWELSPEHQPEGRRSDDLAQERIQTALKEGGTTFEWMHKRLNTGEVFPAEVDLSTISTGSSVLALAVVHDVTKRKRAERDLHVLSAELMQLQDEERRRIGRDLHDSTGQLLAALELALSQAMHAEASNLPNRRTLLEHCARVASQCSIEIRTASYLLHPPLLDELGLLSALRWLADGFRERTGIEVRLDLPEKINRMPPEAELSLFRIAQEALTNVHRHAASAWVAMRLKLQSNSVMLEIEDGGRGLPGPSGSQDGQPKLGVGLAGMRERIRHIGGSFSVESTHTGTRVRAAIAISTGGEL
jgi:two-component system NarL family sensor kinase